MLKSKVLVGFVVFVLGLTYVNSLQMNRVNYEETDLNEIVYIR